MGKHIPRCFRYLKYPLGSVEVGGRSRTSVYHLVYRDVRSRVDYDGTSTQFFTYGIKLVGNHEHMNYLFLSSL